MNTQLLRWRQVNFNSSIFFVLRVPSIWRSLGKWKILSFFLAGPLSACPLFSSSHWSFVLNIELHALWVYESLNVPSFGPMMGLYQIQKGFKSLWVEATGKFWVMGPYFNNADLIQPNLTNKGTKLGVGYISTNGQKLTVFLFPLAVAGMCPFWGTWEKFCFFQAVIHTNLPTLCRVGWPSFFGWSTPGESMTPEFCGKPKKGGKLYM